MKNWTAGQWENTGGIAAGVPRNRGLHQDIRSAGCIQVGCAV